MSDLSEIADRWAASREWLRQQVAFAIFNSTNPAQIRDKITPANINEHEIRSSIGGGFTAVSSPGLDWDLNKASFLKLADVCLMAMDQADEDGSAYAAPEEKRITIEYTNHRGVLSDRRIVPKRIVFRGSEWHPKPQWLLIADDLDKGEERHFALLDIHTWEAS